MFTPQQIDQISFSRARFGGYDMQAVDEFLEPLTEDYATLYKENALLKSKMRVLVGKLDEYRKNEASMKDAIVNAQKTCDKMVREAEARCSQMLSEANVSANASVQNSLNLIAAENARVDEAKKAATAKIDEIQNQLHSCITALDRIKQANAPSVNKPDSKFFDYDSENGEADANAVADEISQNLEALVGTTEERAPKAEPKHPTNATTTSKFANLQFGRNYDSSSQGVR